MANYDKQGILDALDKKIADEQAAFQKKSQEAPEKIKLYEEELEEWKKKLVAWRVGLEAEFSKFLEKRGPDLEITPERMLDRNHFQWVCRQIGFSAPPWPPNNPMAVVDGVAQQSEHCSLAERARARVRLMTPDKNGSIKLSDNDEIFYRGLVPCR